MRNSITSRQIQSCMPGDPDIKSFTLDFNQVEADAFQSVLRAEDHDDYIDRTIQHNHTLLSYDLAVEEVESEEFNHFVLGTKEEDSHMVTPERWEVIRGNLKKLSKKTT